MPVDQTGEDILFVVDGAQIEVHIRIQYTGEAERFAWVVPLLGGDFAVRQWHHAFMWFFVVFVIVHVYLVFHHDYEEGRGTSSSMVGGWKFVSEDEGEPGRPSDG